MTTSKPFHTYENVGYDDQAISDTTNHQHHPYTTNHHHQAHHYHHHVQSTSSLNSNKHSAITTMASNNGSTPTAIAINKTAMDMPFTDPLHGGGDLTASSSNSGPTTTKIFSTTDCTGTTRMLTARAIPGHNLVTKFISFPSQSPMDSFKEWSVSTFKCTKQMINEKRGICSITNDAQLLNDIEQLRATRDKLVQMLKAAQQMNSDYTQLVKTQRQLHGIMNEMSIKCSTNSATQDSNSMMQSSKPGKQVIANFSNLSNNLSATTTTSQSQTNSRDNHLYEFLPILNHIKSSNVNLTEDFKKNSMALNANIKNGEKLISALSFFCSNINTLINKTIDDTLLTIKHYESARLEYDAERNSINFTSQTAQTSINYSSDKLELARVRYEQLKEDVQIKMKFLEENTTKVMHKQLILFNSAFASYSTGNTAALESALRQFSIR